MTSRPVTPPSLDDLGIQRVPWDELGPEFIRSWGRPGGQNEPEHLTVYGKSGGGKTYFVTTVLLERARVRQSHVTVVATKRADRTLTRTGLPITDTWPPGYGENQVIYWAKAKGISAHHRVPQKAKVLAFMNAVWKPNANMVIYWDELAYLQEMLGLGPELSTFYREGRGNGITNVASMQRPSGVTRLAHSEAGWTVAFPPKDQDDRDRVAEVFGARRRYAAALEALDNTRHEFLIRRDRGGETYVSNLPRPPRQAERRGQPAASRGISDSPTRGVPSAQR